MNRNLLSASLALLLAAPLAFGQATQSAPPDSSPAQAANGNRHHGHHGHPDAQQQAAFIAKKFNLSADQQSKLEPILADRDQKIQALRSDTSLTPDQKKAQFKTIRENTNQQLSTVLSPDQLQQLKSARRNFRHGRGGAQPQSQTAPPSGI
jgi:hypothetical protein